MDAYSQDKANPFHKEYGWHQSSIKIRLPKEGTKWPSETNTPELKIPRVYHRSIVDIIESIFMENVATTFNMIPYRKYWQCSPDRSIEVFSEACSSPEMLETYDKINALPCEAGDEYECAIASLMFWFNATHLANFGDASLWPFYLYFRNQSKYVQGKPTTSACHHVAYIPTLPDDLQDQHMKIFGKPSSSEVYTHCKCELMQAIWALLLDKKFMHAYEHGIVIKCSDGVTRRIFPRFFTHLADYPEKVILSGIKSLGQCPCAPCLMKKSEVHLMGTKRDMKRRIKCMQKDDRKHHREVEDAWTLIFQLGVPVDGSHVKNILNDESLVPTWNLFLEKLCPHGFNRFQMFVVDKLHKFELGVWKATFTHLMRILHAAGGHAIQKLNERYQDVPTFGRGTIRKFNTNASAMKHLAAQDFEDLLQCTIPVFEALLLKDHNTMVLDLLFDLATWHMIAKFRLHTKDTLNFFDTTTNYLTSIHHMDNGKLHWLPSIWIWIRQAIAKGLHLV
ncbi:hypothetical protein BDR03DRAFT_979010 [Suillus americanus]|nr:hypothetical protein BDR03DRAFT_979010 [Suillus americanus]